MQVHNEQNVGQHNNDQFMHLVLQRHLSTIKFSYVLGYVRCFTEDGVQGPFTFQNALQKSAASKAQTQNNLCSSSVGNRFYSYQEMLGQYSSQKSQLKLINEADCLSLATVTPWQRLMGFGVNNTTQLEIYIGIFQTGIAWWSVNGTHLADSIAFLTNCKYNLSCV